MRLGHHVAAQRSGDRLAFRHGLPKAVQQMPIERRILFIAINRLPGKGFAYRLESGHGDSLGHLGRHSVTPKYIDQS
jgi:hypothetical protein